MAPPDDGSTIDITDLSETLRASWVDWAVNTLFDAAIGYPYLSWLAFPVVAPLFKALLHWGASTVSKEIIQVSFFLNTAIRKASQAADYVDLVSKKNNLPQTASMAEYEECEKAEMAAFARVVRVTL